MKTIIGIIGSVCAAVLGLIFTSRSSGKKAAENKYLSKQLEKEREEQSYANKVHRVVDNMSSDSKRTWLQNRKNH